MISWSITCFLGSKLSALASENRFIVLSTRLAILGIVLGVSTLITVLAVMRGFENEIRQSLVGPFDQLHVFAFNDYYPDSLYEEIQSLPHVTAVTGYAKSYGLIRSSKRYIPLEILTFESPDVALDVPDVDLGGVYLSSSGMYFSQGDEVNIILPQKDRLRPKVVSPKYLGEYQHYGKASKGLMTALVSFKTYQEMHRDTILSGLVVTVDDLYATADVKAYLMDRYHGLYQGFDWKDKYQPMFSALRMQRLLMVFILSMITLVALFSLVSGLVMLTADRRCEIALLRTMGLSRVKIAGVFMIQGGLISFIGVIMGVILAVVLCYFAQDIASLLESVLGYALIDERIYGTSKLPTALDVELAMSVAIIAWVSGLLASFYPSVRASKVEPAEVLRYV